jgi:hypothetical protein
VNKLIHNFVFGFFGGEMKKSIIALALFALLLSASCSALKVSAPSTIVVETGQKNVPIIIENDSTFDQSFEVSFSAPFEFEITPSEGTLEAGRETVVTFSVSQQPETQETNYQGTLEVRLGQDKAFRKLDILFKEGNTPIIGPDQLPSPGNLTGLISFAGFYSWATGLFTMQNLVNFALIIIAAILLIAFIARFLKRVAVRQ